MSMSKLCALDSIMVECRWGRSRMYPTIFDFHDGEVFGFYWGDIWEGIKRANGSESYYAFTLRLIANTRNVSSFIVKHYKPYF